MNAIHRLKLRPITSQPISICTISFTLIHSVSLQANNELNANPMNVAPKVPLKGCPTIGSMDGHPVMLK